MSSDDYPQELSGVPGIEPMGDASDIASGITGSFGAESLSAVPSAAAENAQGSAYSESAGAARASGATSAESGTLAAPPLYGLPAPTPETAYGSYELATQGQIPVTHVAAANPDAPFDPYAAAAATAQQTWVPSSPIEEATNAPQTAATKIAKTASKVTLIVRIVSYVIVILAIVAAVLWNNSSTPITSAAFERLGRALSGTESFGTFEEFSVSSAVKVDECDPYIGAQGNIRDGQDVYPGFDADSSTVLLRFLEDNDAVRFANATYACLTWYEYEQVTETKETFSILFGVLGKVQTWETIGIDAGEEGVRVHAAVFRNVLALNIDGNSATTPISFDDWNAWAKGPFRDAVNDARNP